MNLIAERVAFHVSHQLTLRRGRPCCKKTDHP